MNVLQLHVPDMTCNHCKTAILEATQGLPGVENVAVDLERKAVEVTTSAALDPKAVISAIETQGFTVEAST